MKTLERLIMEPLRPDDNPLQFTYQPCHGVDGTIIYQLNRVYTHLDKPASTVRIMFFFIFSFFSSTFDTIRPALLAEKLTAMQVDSSLVSWIVDYLTGR